MEYTKGDWQIGSYGNEKYEVLSDRRIAIVDELPNAYLIAAAPDMYEACKAQHEAIDILFARLIELDPKFFPSKSGRPYEAILMSSRALAKAEGRE